MKFDFDEMAALAKSDPYEFERRRVELIKAEINKAPPEHRPKLRALQLKLDMSRANMGHQEFIDYCFKEIDVKLDLMADKLDYLENHLL
jgi:hypothetical protein